MKYIRHRQGPIILFDSNTTHQAMARRLDWPHALIESAGSVILHEGRLWTGGESLSLGIPSIAEDTEIIEDELKRSV